MQTLGRMLLTCCEVLAGISKFHSHQMPKKYSWRIALNIVIASLQCIPLSSIRSSRGLCSSRVQALENTWDRGPHDRSWSVCTLIGFEVVTLCNSWEYFDILRPYLTCVGTGYDPKTKILTCVGIRLHFRILRPIISALTVLTRTDPEVHLQIFRMSSYWDILKDIEIMVAILVV